LQAGASRAIKSAPTCAAPPMTVPLLDVNAQNHPLAAEFTAAFNRVFQSGQFIMGPEVADFERELAAFAGAPHALGVSSGTDALLLALMALEIGPGDEVLVPAFTFFATAGCVARLGATPVFVDVCPVCFNLDPADARAKLTPRTRAIIPVHLFGQAADMDAINALAAAHGLAVIEDAAQAIGATCRGRQCGTLAPFGVLSFFPSKNLGGLGDAGALLCNDDALAARARILRVHGMEPKYHHPMIGGNFRLDSLQAAFLRVKLPHLPAWTAARRANAAAYLDQLAAHPGAVVADPADCRCAEARRERLAASGARLVLPAAYPHNGHIWNQFTLRLPGPGRRDALRAHLAARGIGCEIYYPVALHRQACFAGLPAASLGPCPVAETLAGEVLSLPVFPELSPAARAEVIAAVLDFPG
jgi:dTDP-4-amino-4,6-dideoxygalactose transaminase